MTDWHISMLSLGICFASCAVSVGIALWVASQNREDARNAGHRPAGGLPVAGAPPRDAGTAVVTPSRGRTAALKPTPDESWYMRVITSHVEVIAALVTERLELMRQNAELKQCLADIAALPVEGDTECYTCVRATTVRNSELAQKVSALTVQLEAARQGKQGLDVCVWSYDYPETPSQSYPHTYTTGCNKRAPSLVPMNCSVGGTYCPFCGRKIAVKKTEESHG